MTCEDADTCATIGATALDTTALAGNANVDSIESAANGIITITYKAGVVTADANTLLLTPVAADGTTAVDLSTANAGTQFSWSCAVGGTVDAKYRPANCRP